MRNDLLTRSGPQGKAESGTINYTVKNSSLIEDAGRSSTGDGLMSYFDEAIMDNNQGTKKFSIGPLSMIAIAFNTCNSWAGVSGSMQSAMLQGGPVTLLYGMIISTSAYLSIACVMGELTSVYPTAGGQYHFASILAPQRYHKLIAYICGLFNLVAWLAIASATVMLTSYNIITLVSALRANYVAHPWHLFLVYEAFSTTALLYNALAIKRASWIHDVGCKITPYSSFLSRRSCRSG